MKIEWALVLALSLTAAVTLSGCISPGCIYGSGKVVTENRSLGNYTDIDLRAPAELHLVQGEEQTLRIEAEDNIVGAIRTGIRDSTLVVDAYGCITPTKPVRIYATEGSVRSLAVSGSGSIISDSMIKAEALHLEISGSGNMDLDLICRDLTTSISGSGRAYLRGSSAAHSIVVTGSGSVRAFDLTTNISRAMVSGSGNAEINAARELDVSISGSGTVYYRGGPSTISKSISGSGNLVKAG